MEVRLYAIATAIFVSFSCGRATPKFLADVLHVGTIDSAKGLQDVIQVPALILVLLSVGSSIVCGAFLAPERNRSVTSWGLKGLFGGPLTIIQLRQLDKLITREEEEAKKNVYQQINDKP